MHKTSEVNNEVNIIILCGGKGSRISELTNKYSCKSLIPINGIPIIDYILKIIKKISYNKLIFCIDNHALRFKFEKLIKENNLKNTEIYLDYERGPMQTMYEVVSKFNKGRVLLLFGHHPITKKHIENMLEKDESLLVLSGFKKISEVHSKIAKINNEGIIFSVSRHNFLKKLNNLERYLDLPYLLPIKFYGVYGFPTLKRLFIMGGMDKTNLIDGEKVYVIDADFPHEFHYKEELENIEEFLRFNKNE